MKTGFFSPFPTSTIEVTTKSILQVLTGNTHSKLNLFTDFDSAKDFANKYSEGSVDTAAAYYIEYPPVIEVTLKDESGLFDTINAYRAVVKLENIDTIKSYYYQTGGHSNPEGRIFTLDKPLIVELDRSYKTHYWLATVANFTAYPAVQAALFFWAVDGPENSEPTGLRDLVPCILAPLYYTLTAAVVLTLLAIPLICVILTSPITILHDLSVFLGEALGCCTIENAPSPKL